MALSPKFKMRGMFVLCVACWLLAAFYFYLAYLEFPNGSTWRFGFNAVLFLWMVHQARGCWRDWLEWKRREKE